MKRETLEATAWKVSEDSFLTVATTAASTTAASTTASGMWVNILNRWYVMCTDVKTVGEFLTVKKRDGSAQEVLIEQIVGTFEDKIIYKVKKDAL